MAVKVLVVENKAVFISGVLDGGQDFELRPFDDSDDGMAHSTRGFRLDFNATCKSTEK
jgi:hypothetical protein